MKEETHEEKLQRYILKLVKDVYPIQTRIQNLTQYLNNVQVKKAKK